jgi:hypothetical protein
MSKRNSPTSGRMTLFVRGKNALTHSLNAICPYFTMFPLEFPFKLFRYYAKQSEWVLDPYCGRGTTNFAARLLGMPSVGIDSSPVAAAIAQSKMVHASVESVVATAETLLETSSKPRHLPVGEFWEWAYSESTLGQMCRIREALLENCSDPSRVMLRAILLGGLHGPLNKATASYLSNQCPRTFAPKPVYAVNFWKKRKLRPPKVDLLSIVRRRAHWYLSDQPKTVDGFVIHGDSRTMVMEALPKKFSWVVTSPPYYGLRTYIPDQWLRNWFVGGPSSVPYDQREEDLAHSDPDEFANQLRKVWTHAAAASAQSARLVCRFGAIHDRKTDPLRIIKKSFHNTGWRIVTLHEAGTASNGKRQAQQFGIKEHKAPREEYDVYAVRVC